MLELWVVAPPAGQHLVGHLCNADDDASLKIKRHLRFKRRRKLTCYTADFCDERRDERHRRLQSEEKTARQTLVWHLAQRQEDRRSDCIKRDKRGQDSPINAHYRMLRTAGPPSLQAR